MTFFYFVELLLQDFEFGKQLLASVFFELELQSSLVAHVVASREKSIHKLTQLVEVLWRKSVVFVIAC